MESDQHVECVDCGAAFVLTAADVASFTARGLVPPKRCVACRKARREAKADRRGPGAAHQPKRREEGATKAPASGSGEYRSPMQMGREHRRGPTGDADEYRSPMSPPPRPVPPRGPVAPAVDAPIAQAAQAGEPTRDDDEELGPSERRDDVNEYRSPMTGGARAPAREYRSPMRGGPRGASREYRSPMTQGTGSARGANDYRSPMQSTSDRSAPADTRRGGGGRRAR